MNTEQRAERRWTRGPDADLIHILEPQVHAAELLAEELAGPRGALVAGVGVDNAAAVVEDVDDQVLAAHGHDSAGLEVQGLKAALDGHRRDDLGQLDAMTPLGAGDDATERSDSSKAIHEQRQRPGEIALVGEDRVLNAAVLRDQAELQGGGSDIDSERLFSHSHYHRNIPENVHIKHGEMGIHCKPRLCLLPLK